jgi:hypothetical protein
MQVVSKYLRVSSMLSNRSAGFAIVDRLHTDGAESVGYRSAGFAIRQKGCIFSIVSKNQSFR